MAEIKASNNTEMYFKSRIYEPANEYAQNNLFNFLQMEKKINDLNIDEVTLGQGIYINDFNMNTLPTFYYLVFIKEEIEYVLKVFDNGENEYVGSFGKNHADTIKKYALETIDYAPEYIYLDQNEIIIKNDEVNIVSKLNNINQYKLSNRNRANLTTVDITENLAFIKPKTRLATTST